MTKSVKRNFLEAGLFVALFALGVAVFVSVVAVRTSSQLPKPKIAGVATAPGPSHPDGDCNGDGLVDAADLTALALEIEDGDGMLTADVGGGSFAGTQACDADSNGIINPQDQECIEGFIFGNPAARCTSDNNACEADINQDGVVDLVDYGLILSNFFKENPRNVRVDITQDGVVDLADFGILQKNFFKTCNL